ncbi:MAG: DinB family protein [Phycisphaerales bacterium]|nr:DinB family protein [Phycisphaerales bacterium]
MPDIRTQTLREYFLTLLTAESQANGRSLDSLATVPEMQHATEVYRRALGVMAHVMIAKRVWMQRLLGEAWKVDDWFAPWPIDESRKEATRIDGVWRTFLTDLPDGGFDREIEYSMSDGSRARSKVVDICAHVMNHATYHRGQIARIVHELGGTRASTDLIVFTRRTL